MKNSTLRFLHDRFKPTLSNIEQLDDETDQDKATKWFQGVPDYDGKAREAQERLLNGPPLDDVGDTHKRNVIRAIPPFDEPVTEQEWNPSGTQATYTEHESALHKLFEKNGFVKDGGANTEHPNNTKHKYCLGVERKAGSCLNGLHSALTAKGYEYSDSGDGNSGFWQKQRHKISCFRDREKGTVTLIHRQPKDVRPTEASTETLPVEAAFVVEAAPKRYLAIMETLKNVFRKSGMPIENKDPIRITPAARGGLLVVITSAHTQITFKKMMTIRAYLTHSFKAVDFKVQPSTMGTKMSLTYFVTIKDVKKPKEAKPEPKTAVSAKKDKSKDKKKPKTIEPISLKKFSAKKLKKRLEGKGKHKTKADVVLTATEAAYRRVDAYAKQTLGNFSD